jgi:hypothetical protein
LPFCAPASSICGQAAILSFLGEQQPGGKPDVMCSF